MSLPSKTLFDQYLHHCSSPLSVYHYSAIFAWQDFFQFKVEIINGQLCVFAFQGQDSFLYLPPLGGELNINTIEQCFKLMGKSKIARIENICANQLPILKAHGYNEHFKAHEYVYRRDDLACLSGQAYKSKRHDINAFNEHYPQAVYREYVPGDYQGCVALYKHWALNRRAHYQDDIYLAMLDENAQVHALLIANAEELGLSGRIVSIGGRIAAYTFGYGLDKQTFCVSLEITDLSKNGLAAFIFNQFCADDMVKDCKFINTMDDFGMPNVAAAKEAYHPIEKKPVYTVRKA